VLRKIFRPNRGAVTGAHSTRNRAVCTPNIVRVIKSRGMRRGWEEGMWDVWGREQLHTGFWLGNLRKETTWNT